MQISDRTVVVTGASRGIGQATARALARSGGRIALLARSRDVDQVATEIVANGGQARGYAVDLTDAAAVERVGQSITTDMGDPEILINNAGAGRWLFVEETSPEEAAAMIASPYLAAFYVTRVFLPAMLQRRQGCIVNVLSPAAWAPWPGAAAYTAARFALRGLTAALRMDLRDTGVRVVAVVPHKVSSTYFAHNPNSEERLPAITRLIATQTPEQVAAAILRGIERDRRTVVIPSALRGVLAAHALMPTPIEWLMWRTGWRRAAQKGTNEK